MLLQLVFSPICYVIFVIFTHTSDTRLMMRDCRRGYDVFNVVLACVQSVTCMCKYHKNNITNRTEHKL
jgi:hypothetical protein